MPVQTKPPRRNEEIKALQGYARRWAVLASMAEKILKNTATPLKEVSGLLKTSRIKISSGCYPACELNCELNWLEAKLLPYMFQLNDRDADRYLELLGKATAGALTEDEVNTVGATYFDILKSIPSDCLSAGCECKS